MLQNLQTFLGRPDPGVGIEWCTYYLKKPCFSLPFITLFTFTMNIYLQNTRLLFCQIKICETLLNWNIKALKMTLYKQEKEEFNSIENSEIIPVKFYRKDTKFLKSSGKRSGCLYKKLKAVETKYFWIFDNDAQKSFVLALNSPLPKSSFVPHSISFLFSAIH